MKYIATDKPFNRMTCDELGKKLGVKVTQLTTHPDGKMYKLLILHDPATPQDLFYMDVDGAGWVLKATHNASADVPQALETVLFRYCVSIANGATGGVNAQLDTGFTYATLYDL